MNPSRKGNAMESKAADVFAFGMFGVEVFTGKIPFEEQKNGAVVLRISGGGRPEMPENAQAVGLTGEMWKLFESCWQQDPKKRPTMVEVVGRWQGFVKDDGGTGGVIECVHITLLIRPRGLIFGSIPNFYSRLGEPSPVAGPIPGTNRLPARSKLTQLRTKFGGLRLRMTPDVVQQGERPGAVQRPAQCTDPPPSKCVFSGEHDVY